MCLLITGEIGDIGARIPVLCSSEHGFFLKVYGEIPDSPDFPLPRYIHIATANSVSFFIPVNDENARLTDEVNRAFFCSV